VEKFLYKTLHQNTIFTACRGIVNRKPGKEGYFYKIISYRKIRREIMRRAISIEMNQALASLGGSMATKKSKLVFIFLNLAESAGARVDLICR
jgi:hypothetical protein